MFHRRTSLTTAIVVLLVACAIGTANAATRAQIETAIQKGITWLAGQQNPDGSWGSYDRVGHTGLAVVKLEERAIKELHLSPFDPAYMYSAHVKKGLDYLFGQAETHGPGKGICFAKGHHETYSTGIAMMAIAASESPNRLVNMPGSLVDGWTYQQVLHGCVDFFVWSQNPDGAWRYRWKQEPSDQSNTGYAVLGLAYAEQLFGIPVPASLKSGLNNWINTIQDDVDGDTSDGGSWYTPASSWVNLLKTGNLIFEMTFVGDVPSDQRFKDAMAYIERHWRDSNVDPGWGFARHPANYQAMYCLMKGLQYSGIDLIDTDGDTVPDDNWFNQEPTKSPSQDFASVLVAHQRPDGSWPSDYWGNPILTTAWALLTLEKSAPPPPLDPLRVQTLPCSDIGMHGATLWGRLLADPEEWGDPYRFNYWKHHTTGVEPVHVTEWMDFEEPSGYPADFGYDVCGLEPGTTYSYWAQFKTPTRTNDWCSGVITFTTLSSPVQILSPNGGECLLGGEATEIVWGADKTVDSVVLSYSVDDGQTWDDIATLDNDDANKHHPWTPGILNSTKCLMQIRDAADAGTMDTSDGVFEICDPGIPDVAGMTETQAKSALESRDYTTGRVRYIYLLSTPAGQVAFQWPLAGKPAPAGTAVNLLLSHGAPADDEPTAQTKNASDVAADSARLWGKISKSGGGTCRYRFYYWTRGDRWLRHTDWEGYAEQGESFSLLVDGLKPGRKYWFWAEARNSAGFSDGWASGVSSFTTSN